MVEIRGYSHISENAFLIPIVVDGGVISPRSSILDPGFPGKRRGASLF